MSHPAIEVEGVAKTFRIPAEDVTTLKERVLNPFRRSPARELRVLQDVSFRVERGEFFGIVGRNGSGKSTLLKCLAGIYGVDAGRMRVAGRLAPFIELGVGFNMELTARDNALINGVMMGLTPAEARARFGDVIAYAGLEDFTELKLKNFSSGMQVRLGFALMVHADADVLLIDEVLAVGDAQFQRRCLDTFWERREAGRTTVLVTHDMSMVERFCHRALLLDRGRIARLGDPAEVSHGYLELNYTGLSGDAAGGGAPGLAGGDEAPAAFEAMEVCDEHGEPVAELENGQPCLLRARVRVHAPLVKPTVHLWIDPDSGPRVFHVSTRDVEEIPAVEAGRTLVFEARLPNPLAAGRFWIGGSIRQGPTNTELVTHHDRVAPFTVRGAELSLSLVGVPFEGRVVLDGDEGEWRPAEPTGLPRTGAAS